MADPIRVTCPLCRDIHAVVHALDIYPLMPPKRTDDGELAVKVALCTRTGEFLYKTTAGTWQGMSLEINDALVGAEEDDDDSDTPWAVE